MNDSLFNNMFKSRPTTRQIVERLAEFNPNLINNDRIFCFFFDQIALNNGYQYFELPSYWTIVRTVYSYKKDNNIRANNPTSINSPKTQKKETDRALINTYQIETKNLNIKQIIGIIAKYNKLILTNDRKLIKLFDNIAIKNGYSKNNLPKYWTIIRAAYDYKKNIIQKEPKI